MLKGRKIRMPRAGQRVPLATRLKLLSADERAQIAAICRAGTLDDARAQIKVQHGIEIKYNSVLSTWLQWQARQEALDGQNRLAEQLRDYLAKYNPGISPDRMREAQLDMLFQIAEGSADSRTMLQVLAEKGRNEDRRLEREKFEEARKQNEAAKAVAGNTAMSADEKAARMKEIFGLK